MKSKPTIIRKSRGFALIVTLSLMILLTVVAVGLLTLSSVALRSSSQGNAMATARANAKMAMMLALGDLQKYAGPDQRVTALKDLNTVASTTTNPLYTGVWSTVPTNPVTPLDKANPLAWLVSGNGATGLPTTPLVSATHGGTEVRAPIQEVKSTAAGQLTGAFAYWIADEGVKARINHDSPGFRTTVTATDAIRAFAGSPRSAIELMETAASPQTGAVSSAWGNALYPYVAETTSKLVTTGQLPLYATAGNQTATHAATKARFHDLTAHSAAVLSNTANGGLRQDLTRILSDSAKPGPADSDLIFPAVGTLPAEIHRRPPTWGRLRAWWNNPIDPATGSLTPALGSDTTPTIAPVVMWAELGLAIFSEDLSTATPPGSGYRLRIQAFPRAILWNPYNVPMAGRSYELGISTLLPNGGFSERLSLEQTSGTTVGSFYISKYSFNAGATGKYARFRVTVPRLEPGQARVFSLSSIGGSILEVGDNPGNYTILNASANDWLDTNLPPPYRLRAFTDPHYSGLITFYLRDTGVTDPGVPNLDMIPSKSFQFATHTPFSQPGILGSSNLISLPNVGACAPQPQFRMVQFACMNWQWVRWIANGNQIAPYLSRHQADVNGYPLNRSDMATPYQRMLPSTLSGDVSVSTDMSSRLDSTGNPIRLALREPRNPDAGLYQSIAQLQHAPLSDTGVGPLYVVGNSLQNPRIAIRADTSITTTGRRMTSPLYDSSYLTNQALWDKYFFSTVPSALSAADLQAPGYKLPNARLQPTAAADPGQLKKHHTAAANLMLLGGFNINSTSEQAWRAILAAAQDLKYNPATGALAPSDPLRNPFSRFLRPSGDSTDRYRGYRQLTDAQIAALAAAIVAEVRTRGPFRSLADFVNRRLVPNTDVAAATGLKGALQAAIDAVDTDATTAKQVNNLAPYNTDARGPLPSSQLDTEAWVGFVGSGAKVPTSSIHVFGPGYLTQADVLSRIGSAITARSDTFIIRTCGEARNGGTITARAYCEAVVQRNPDYVDRSTAPEAAPATGSVNERFGRHFSIISFRWLSSNEI